MRTVLVAVLLAMTFSVSGADQSRAEVEALIKKIGSTPPDWFQSTPLNYPKTLDLSWRDNPGPWDPSRNVGQFI